MTYVIAHMMIGPVPKLHQLGTHCLGPLVNTRCRPVNALDPPVWGQVRAQHYCGNPVGYARVVLGRFQYWPVPVGRCRGLA